MIQCVNDNKLKQSDVRPTNIVDSEGIAKHHNMNIMFKWLQLDSSKEFLDIQANIECGFTLKHVLDMTRIYSQYILDILDLYFTTAKLGHVAKRTSR